MDEQGYWTKWSKRRIGRRRFLAGAAVGAAGLASATLVGCGSDENKSGTLSGSSSPTGDELFPGHPPTEPYDARQTYIPAPADSRGGTFTYIGFDPVVLDRYDPHQTQFGPMYSNQSAVFSKLYMYASHEDPTWENILPDLATAAPEMVEDPPLTYIVKLRQGVKFHDTDQIRSNFPNLAGRELTADDVIYSYERQRNHDSYQRTYYYRSSQYETIDTIKKVDDYTIKITTKEPTAPFYHFMADTNAMIIPKEIVDMDPGPDGHTPWDSVDAYGTRNPPPAQRMIGTGPFIWDKLTFGIEFNAKRNPNWFGWADKSLGRPYVDAYKVTGQGLNDATVESLFRRKQIDVGVYIDNPAWIQGALDDIPNLYYHLVPISGWLNSRLKTYSAPFNDWRVRRALHLAADRQDVIDIIGSGAYRAVGPVGRAVKLWALPDSELAQLPGYRTDPAKRQEDLTEARQLYEAAGKPDIPQIWFADVPDYIPRYSSTYIQTIKANLGITSNIRTQTVPYSRIAEGFVSEDPDLAAMTWGYDNGWIDLDDWVYPYFKTGGPKNSFRVSDPALDTLLDSQRREFDQAKRKLIGYDIQRYLLGETKKDAPAANNRIDYAAPLISFLYWPYVKNPTPFPWFGNNHWGANTWLDKSDPSFDGRP